MHCVLQIPEILLNIFSHLIPSSPSFVARNSAERDLASLARTCRAFKEPALDILWAELNDLGTLSRCLPEIAHKTRGRQDYNKHYSFTRPLKQAEWDVLRSYARRVCSLSEFRGRLDWKFLGTSTSTLTNPLFPNLRSLHCKLREDNLPLLRLPFPSLSQLDFSGVGRNLPVFQDLLKSLAKTSPNVKRFSISTSSHEPEFNKVICSCICGWSKLQTITCSDIVLNTDALAHLSHMPTLTRLTFALDDTFPDRTPHSNAPSFSNLNYLELNAESLAPISRLLFWIRLPAVAEFVVTIKDLPSKQGLTSFMAGIQMVGMDQTIQTFKLEQMYHHPETNQESPSREPGAPLLLLDDLWPCAGLHSLRHLEINIGWDVGLSDDQLLPLGSAWPLLQELSINKDWGWNRSTGITPFGLAKLLRTCPSLTSMSLAIDTRGFTMSSAGKLRESAGISSFDGPFSINVIDSALEQGSVAAMAAFFCEIAPHFHFVLACWDGWSVEEPGMFEPDHIYHDRWESVSSKATELIREKWLGVLRQLLFKS